MAIARKTARLDLIHLSATVLSYQSMTLAEARLIGEIIGSLCRDRDKSVDACLTPERVALLRRYSAEAFDEMQERYGWQMPESGSAVQESRPL